VLRTERAWTGQKYLLVASRPAGQAENTQEVWCRGMGIDSMKQQLILCTSPCYLSLRLPTS